jgi:enoyl-CoA hydratase/carnithine racemase
MESIGSGSLLFSEQDGVAVITFNRPEARNALTPEMLCRFDDALAACETAGSVRAIIVTGAGEQAFCSGGDLAQSLPLLTGARPVADDWDRRVLQDPVVAGMRRLETEIPVIAAINGVCLAAGMELALATDIRIAAEHATFGLPEVRHALIPFAGALARLPRQVPPCIAMQMVLEGAPITAAEAHRIGLVNQVAPGADVMPRALEIARRIARNGPIAVRQAKRTMNAAIGLPLEAGLRLEQESKRIVLATEDAREGPRAFMERRPPSFTGR